MGIHKKLFDQGLIEQSQYNYIEMINDKSKVSVFYELRSLLYVGILFFTSGVAYFGYNHFTHVGHLFAMLSLSATLIFVLYKVFKLSHPFSANKVIVEHNYFDYFVLFVALLWISLWTYIQFYFGLLEILIRPVSFVSTLLFFGLAYRFDNKAVLVLGITSLAASVGVTVSPLDWINGGYFSLKSLYYSSIVLGTALILISYVTIHRGVKNHFRSTYLHFGYLLLISGLLVAEFESDSWGFIVMNILFGVLISICHWKTREFLFFFYGNLLFYIVFNHLIYKSVGMDIFIHGLYHYPLTLLGYIVFILSNKQQFSDD